MTAHAAPAPADLAGRDQTARRRALTLWGTILASGMTFIDATVINIALPEVGRDLGAGLAAQQWIVLGYTLALASSFMLGGALGDRYGRRRLFVWSTLAFAVTSVAAGLAPDEASLIAARVAQGIAGAFVATNSLALLRSTFGAQSGAAVGTWTAWTGITMIIGPVLGGVLVESASWRWIFLINVPFAVAAIVLARAGECRAAASAPRDRTPLNLPSSVAVAVAFGGLAFGLVEWADSGVAAALPALAAALVGGVAFVAAERRAEEPLVPAELLRDRTFVWANVTTLLVYAALGGSTFYLALYLQSGAVGFSAVEASLVFVPISLTMLVLARRFGQLADERGPRGVLIGGPLAMAAGVAVWGAVTDDTGWAALLPGLLLFALGLSMLVAPITNTALQAAPDRLSGLAAGVNTAVSRLGGLVAIALVGLVISTSFAARTDADPDAPFARSLPGDANAAATDAFRAGMAACAALLVAGALAAAVGIRAGAPAHRQPSEDAVPLPERPAC